MSDMRNLLDIINEMSEEEGSIELHDSFDFELNEETFIESGIVGFTDDGIIVECDETALQLLESNGLQLEEVEVDESGLQAYLGNKKYGKAGMDALRKAGREGASKETMAQIRAKYDKLDEVWDDEAYINSTQDVVELLATLRGIGKGIENGRPYDGNFANLCANYLGYVWNWLEPRVDENDPKLQPILNDVFAVWKRAGQLQRSPESGSNRSLANEIINFLYPLIQWVEMNSDKIQSVKVREDEVDEAKYQGREVPLGKPMAGDVKKSKVYVKGPKGNVVKVNFGDKKMRIKKSNPGRRKNFRARHNCDNPGPRWKARYWSCRAW